MRIALSPEAVADLERLQAFLAEKNPDAAQRTAAAIARAVQSLDLFADRGRMSGPRDWRELVVPFGRSAYIVRYAYDTKEGEVIIVRVWHGRELRE